jgi:hypothetical protein
MGFMSPRADTFGTITNSLKDSIKDSVKELSSEKKSVREIRHEDSPSQENPAKSKPKSKFAKRDENSAYFSPIDDRKEKSNLHMTMSPLMDKTNFVHVCNCATSTNNDNRQVILQQIMKTTALQNTQNLNRSPEAGLNSSPKIAKSPNTPPQITPFNSNPDYSVKNSPKQTPIGFELNQEEAKKEYGFDRKSSSQATPEEFANDSKEELFTKSGGDNSINKASADSENLSNTQLSPISKVEDDSSEKYDNSSLDKIPQREADLKKLTQISAKSKKASGTKKASLKGSENIDLNIIKTLSTKSRPKTKKDINTIPVLEKHSSKLNSEYLRVFATESRSKIFPETMMKMKALNMKLRKQETITKKRKRSSVRSKKRTKRSPINFKGLQQLFPIKYGAKRSRSPVIIDVEAVNNKLKSRRVMLNNLKKRRRSIEATYQTNKSKSRKKSPWSKKFNFKKRIKAKSPKIIVPPAIDCKTGKLGRDRSMVIFLQLNIS